MPKTGASPPTRRRRGNFSTPKGAFRGKAAPAEYDSTGLEKLRVCPTPLDSTWVFVDAPCTDDAVYADMVRGGSDGHKTALDRLRESVGSESTHGDSCELGLQCFEDGRWPDRTDLACWWCLHGFDTRPFPCPVRRDCWGRWWVRGVFCGPSCAKAWARHGGQFTYPANVSTLIDILAASRGFAQRPGARSVYIPPAPPREALQMFRGPEHGMTLEQFRGMCAHGFDVQLVNPPMVTQKQVLMAEYQNLLMCSKSHAKQVCHTETPQEMAMSTVDVVRNRQEGLRIFNKIGGRKLEDYVAVKK